MPWTNEQELTLRAVCALEHIALALQAEAEKLPNIARALPHGKECFICGPKLPSVPEVPPPPTISWPKGSEHHKSRIKNS